MALMGIVKEVKLDGDHVVVFVETGSGPWVTAVVSQASGVDFRPLPGDGVICDKIGADWVVLALLVVSAEASGGEWRAFSRDASGNVTGSLHLKADGSVWVNNGTDFVSLASKVNAMFDLIDGIFTTWTPPPTPDSGAALKTAWSAFAAGKQDVSSSKLRSD